MAFPSNIDTPYLTMQGTTTLADASADHALSHRTLGSAVVAIENKLGVNSGSASVNQLLFGQGAGSTSWGSSGTAFTWVNSKFNTGTLGTVTIINGSDAQGDLYFRSAGGTVNRLAPGTVGQVLKTNGAGSDPSWTNASVQQVIGTHDTTTVTTTSSSFVDISSTECTLTPTFKTGKALITLTFGCSNSTGSGARVGGQILVNGTVHQSYYVSPGKADPAGNAGNYSAHIYLPDISTGLGTVKGQFTTPDGGTAIVNYKSISIVEYA